MNRLVLGVSFLLMTACGGTGSVLTSSAGTPSPQSSANLQQLSTQFAALNMAANAALAGASQQLQASATIDQAKAAITTALNAYLAFDSGLQHLSLPSSMSADVTSQLHADSLVEADYQNAESDNSLGQMQSTRAVQAGRERRRGASRELIADIGEPADLGLQRARGGKAEDIDIEWRLHFMIAGILYGADDLLTCVCPLRSFGKARAASPLPTDHAGFPARSPPGLHILLRLTRLEGGHRGSEIRATLVSQLLTFLNSRSPGNASGVSSCSLVPRSPQLLEGAAVDTGQLSGGPRVGRSPCSQPD